MDETGRVSHKAFRYHARLHLPDLQPLLKIRLDEAFAAELTTWGKEKEGNNVILVGDKLASETRFFEDAVGYTTYSIGVPRKTLSPFTSSDGTHVPANNWIVVPQQRMMKDPTLYRDPETFDGFRFVMRGDDSTASESRLSHPSWRFPFWGSVKQACPARFYVTDMTKMIISHFLMKYDMRLANENVADSFAWGPLRVPHPYLGFLLKER
ncbi:MAG: hypothetical protein Q9206_001377 [Seirophora lacunosa]